MDLTTKLVLSLCSFFPFLFGDLLLSLVLVSYKKRAAAKKLASSTECRKADVLFFGKHHYVVSHGDKGSSAFYTVHALWYAQDSAGNWFQCIRPNHSLQSEKNFDSISEGSIHTGNIAYDPADLQQYTLVNQPPIRSYIGNCCLSFFSVVAYALGVGFWAVDMRAWILSVALIFAAGLTLLIWKVIPRIQRKHMSVHVIPVDGPAALALPAVMPPFKLLDNQMPYAGSAA